MTSLDEMNREQIIDILEQNREHLLGMTIGSGMYYRYAEMNKVNLILTISASRFRQMGFNSLAGSLPYGSANDMVFDYATREILPQSEKIPVVFGLFAEDPLKRMSDYIPRLRASGFSGICNMPTVSIMDGRYRKELEKAGFSFDREVEAIRMAHELNILTLAMVRDEEQALKMLDAGADIIGVHFGAAKGGVLGTKHELSIRGAEEMANQIFAVCLKRRPSVFRMLYGGPAKTPAAIRYLIEATRADGFIGGYTFERLLVEKSMQDNPVKEIFFGADEPDKGTSKQKEKDYVQYMQDYVEQYYTGKISLARIAEELYISRPHLSNVIQKELGESFSDYLIGYRMYKASNLLINTTLSVAEIGSLVGYPDYAHFSKLFSKKTGASPSQYRKQYQIT